MSGARVGATPLSVNTLTMPAPLTSAFVVPAAARLVVLSGLTAKDSEGKPVAPNDPEAQADHILGAIDGLLKGAGGSIDDVIRITVFVSDRAHAAAVGRARARWFTTEPYPASTMVVAQLMSDDSLVEFEALAALPDR